MPIARNSPPKQSLAKLRAALAQLASVKESRKGWMRIHPGRVRSQHILQAHPVYAIRLLDLVAGQPLGSTLHRVGWMYFLRGSDGRLACAEVSIVAGRHRSFRLAEGPFVLNAFRTLETARNDARLRGRPFRLRSVRVESLHAFAFWLRGTARKEFWVPATPIGAAVAPGQWLTRQEFAGLLAEETRRITAAHERAAQLARELQARQPPPV